MGDQLSGHPSYLSQLLHQIILGVQPSGGIHDEYISSPGLGGANGIVDHCPWIGSWPVSNDIAAHSLSPYLELVDGRSAEGVGRS